LCGERRRKGVSERCIDLEKHYLHKVAYYGYTGMWKTKKDSYQTETLEKILISPNPLILLFAYIACTSPAISVDWNRLIHQTVSISIHNFAALSIPFQDPAPQYDSKMTRLV
jgi:hypothetical protein